MGLGYWLTEKVVYDENSGQLLTHNTWVNGITVEIIVCHLDLSPTGVQTSFFKRHSHRL